jgi:hypothetical protein
MRGGWCGKSMSGESVVRLCGMWKRIMPPRSTSEHDLRHSLRVRVAASVRKRREGG